MRSTGPIVIIAAAALGACESQAPQPQQSNLVDATRSDPVAPSAADGNDIITGSGTTTAPAGGQEGGGQQGEQGPPPQ